MILTEQMVRESSEFKSLSGEVIMVHNVYHDSGGLYSAFIVIHRDKSRKYSITRFFSTGVKMSYSYDYSGLSSREVFSKLLTDYSSGLR